MLGPKLAYSLHFHALGETLVYNKSCRANDSLTLCAPLLPRKPVTIQLLAFQTIRNQLDFKVLYFRRVRIIFFSSLANCVDWYYFSRPFSPAFGASEWDPRRSSFCDLQAVLVVYDKDLKFPPSFWARIRRATCT